METKHFKGEKSGERIEYHITIHDMPSNERPRERLLSYGPQALSTAELLAIVLRTGTRRNNVVELAAKLLVLYGGLGGLMGADLARLCREHGLGAAKAAQLKAALELGRRLQLEQPEARYRIISPADAARLVMMEMAYLEHEEMWILLLDTKNQVVAIEKRYKGTVNSSVLRAAEVFRPAILRNCPSILICHNHPSGDPTPSPEDIAVTEQLVAAGHLLDTELIDHLVIGKQRYVSLKEQLRW
ncbi:MAG: DNA repair protein RadC [Thermogemmatispora sp.]|uniref:RadC family protein n=1 Tax=Thermogemmatispora sp. TaxID=1968838 RepID=UPI00261F19A7|nr:DNA repair protein RadC [Thermogemmatispora sp.]MBX5457459.1 DNA repair protein RadC [Thermogemmatispora sp.]